MSLPMQQFISPIEAPASLLSETKVSRVGIGHALVHDCSSRQVCSSIIAHARRNGKAAYVITPNAQHIVLLDKDEKFRQIYSHADLVIADGISLLLAARFHGRVLQERIAGVDVFRELCGLAADETLNVFFLGGRPGSADLAAAALRAQFPSLRCTTHCPPHGFEASPDGLMSVEAAITAAKPHLLFVGLGAPKQEYWIHDHGVHLSVPICIGVGGSFELIGGVVPRAPAWMQNIACEWLFRLFREPRRLWRRYLIGNLAFINIVVRQRARRALLNKCVKLAARNKFAAEFNEIVQSRASSAVEPLKDAAQADVARVQDSIPV